MSTILVTYDDSVQIISFNSPNQLNAISYQCYKDVAEALQEGVNNESVSFTILTGVGKTYSVGTNLNDGANVEIEERLNAARDFVKAFIDYPKLLIALVNGPAIGIACTTLGLCDLVYATKSASFACPFNRLGITAEGCSTITFPLIMGKMKANEFLYSNKTWNALEAQTIGLVNGIIDDGLNARMQLIKKIKTEMTMYKLPLMYTKSMILSGVITKDELYKANDKEFDRLAERLKSKDFYDALAKFILRKKLKNKL